ncbi:soluble lytic murein transglycosylase-like protein [Pseudomonas nitritireducens]|uniref:Soluble lytic murein transglycosylase-like protein n=1 Tax=Pseudomonas nitroreducens TaxID=46680 RepID=A0A7W7KEI9_PSENT|nr:lytic transglycosylase domain-containing protein [Pseudomonas nitritireducens]MBB4861372.1 soluble lytic murein transglycosylase-like protein [Pseudomonas nitritireducens]
MADLPPEVPLDLMQINQCIAVAQAQFPNVAPIMTKTVLAVEGGQIGTIRKNTDNSFDMGPMQINTTHLVDIFRRFGYTARDLVYNPCKNIMAGTWLLSRHMTDNEGKAWVAIGNYHSKTPSVRRTYLEKAVTAYSRLVEGIRVGRESESLGRTTNWGRSLRVATSIPSLAALEAAIEADPGAVARPYSAQAPVSLRAQPESRVITIDTRQKKLRFIE